MRSSLVLAAVTALFAGDPTFPYMRVWIKRQGRWLAVATQSMDVGR